MYFQKNKKVISIKQEYTLMELDEFTKKIAGLFRNTDPNLFNAKTELKELDEWSSLMALSIVSMIDEEYDVMLRGDDVKNLKTIEQLFNVVKEKSEKEND